MAMRTSSSNARPERGEQFVLLIDLRLVPPLVSTSLENALMPSLDLDRSLVRYPDAVPYKHRQQRDRDADERSQDEEPDEAGMLDHEAREASQNAAGKGAERGQQAELARRMLH